MAKPRIALIHATTLAMAPITDAFARDWPEAETMHLLDSSLSDDRMVAGELTESISNRIQGLAKYASDRGVDGILYTCSAFGVAIEAAAVTRAEPVLKPNEAVFERALEIASKTSGDIVMLATFPPSIGSMEEEFEEMRAAKGVSATLRSIGVMAARDALNSGDAAGHDRLLAEAAKDAGACDAIMLAHFSMDRAHAAISAAVDMPVLSPPTDALVKMRALLA
jgi:hypothetical protein